MAKEKTLSDLFLAQVKAQPNKISVVYNDESLTYSELAEKSTILALHLEQIGVGQEACIGLYLESSIELVVGVWGILLSGNAYLPLSTEYPEIRLQFMISNSNAKFIVTQEKYRYELQKILPEGVMTITLEDTYKLVSDQNKQNHCLDNSPDPDNLAYVIYTSGSTGEPKGVMIEHRAIVSQMNWLKSAYLIDESKTILQKTPISFDAAQWEILALACGSKIIIGGEGIYRDPERISEEINKHKVTTLQCVPTLLQALVHSENFGSCSSLIQLFSGGEALSKKLAVQFLNILPDCILVNLYGPTECTINASSYTVTRATMHQGPNMIPIGFPVDGTEFCILNENLLPVADNETGELYIGGIQLARGYINRPDMTESRFIRNPQNSDRCPRLYKTGDRAYWNINGSAQFTGRADNQVKLRGYRVELDEVRVAIENHSWVKHAVVLVQENPTAQTNNLMAFVELDSKQAALMDQGTHGSHHQSKRSRLQTKVQLSDPGCLDISYIDPVSLIELPFKEPSATQRKFAFSRKTYRFYEGGSLKKEDILTLLECTPQEKVYKGLANLHLNELGEFLRYFGQFRSEKRLLPKYSYASPGALYATQMYLQINDIAGLAPGIYYYHPVHHHLVLISENSEKRETHLKIHFVGKKSAIEAVYKNNIQEVLEIEVGHMVAVFEKVLPAFGLCIDDGCFTPETRVNLKCTDDDYYLGTFEIVPSANPSIDIPVDIYVQSHNNVVEDMPKGIYQYEHGKLEMVSGDIILKNDVIAINQEVYERSSFGIAIVSKTIKEWKCFIDLGRKLQHLQMNGLRFGFMSAGYSSKSGNDLPSATRLKKILKNIRPETGHSYFSVGGLISDEQLKSEGMNEDIVHMKGPAEMLRDDLINHLPHYMVPNNIIIVDNMPHTPNRKIDIKAIEKLAEAHLRNIQRDIVLPRTRTEKRISDCWKKVMKIDELSVSDDFFELGGNSLTAVALLNEMNRDLKCKLPMQALFEHPTIEKLARKVNEAHNNSISRLVSLQKKGKGKPIFCWPGLGGYAMNLRPLAKKVGAHQPFYGIQAFGLNEGEPPYKSISEMAKRDIEEIKSKQPKGPYTLWGFSFGARVAFETCYQLEESGDIVRNLVLIAPGSPKIWTDNQPADCHKPEFTNPAFVTILFSVFAGKINDQRLSECLAIVKDEKSFASFICAQFDNLSEKLVKRIIRIVSLTYEFRYNFSELLVREIKAPVFILKAKGDDYSFIENSHGFSAAAPTVIQLNGDHYSILKEPYINELVASIPHLTEEIGSRNIRDSRLPVSNYSHTFG